MLATLGWKLEQARKQRQAVVEIQRAGGFVIYDWQGGDPQKTRPASWLRQRLGDDVLNAVSVVHLNSTQVTDTDLGHLEGLPRLESLHLGGPLEFDGPQVTDAELLHLKRLTRLETLIINGPDISDAGLEHLSVLTKLQRLDVACPQITDAGVDELSKALPNCAIRR